MSKAIIVCGDRYWKDRDYIDKVLDEIQPDILIEGEAKGADKYSRYWAEENGYTHLNIAQSWRPVIDIPDGCKFDKPRFIPIKAEWERYGRSAGPIRNRQQAKLLCAFRELGYEVEVIAFHNNITQSKGTADMLKVAKREGLPTRLLP